MRSEGRHRSLAGAAVAAAACAVLLAVPTPAGLPLAGQRVLAVTALAVGLWGSEALPAGVTGIVVVVALVLLGAVPDVSAALAGFADPVVYFLIGVLTIGLAVQRSGLAERVAHLFLRGCRGRPRTLYLQLLAAFPLLTLLLPSATTRTGILVHVYDQALELSGVPPGAPLARAVMMALNSINRLASTVLLTGGITPIVAAGLIGGISWPRWFVLMSVPYGVLLVAGAGLIYLRYRRGFEASLPLTPEANEKPLSPVEWRTAIITAGASLLWLTDALHPALPAMLAWVCLLAPVIGVLSWNDFERGVGWANFFVIASSLSLAQALVSSGASAWLAALVVNTTPSLARSPLLVVVDLARGGRRHPAGDPQHHWLSRHHHSRRHVHRDRDRSEPPRLRAGGDDRRGRRPLLPCPERLLAGGVSARPSQRAGDLPLRSLDDLAGGSGRADGGAAVLERDRRTPPSLAAFFRAAIVVR